MCVFKEVNSILKTDYKSDNEINWILLSIFHKLPEYFIEKYSDKLSWDMISEYQELSEPFIDKHKNDVNWIKISTSQKLSELFIEKYSDKISFYDLPRNLYVPFEVLSKYLDKINFCALAISKPLTEEFISKYRNSFDWYYICKYQKLSNEFIINNCNLLWWENVIKYQKLSNQFIDENFQLLMSNCYKLNKHLPKYQKLSIENITKYINELDLECLIKYQKLPVDIITKNNASFLKNAIKNKCFWQYQPTEFKKQKLAETGKYECHDDYFIAYKAIRPDRYSLFNFQYQYLPNKTYESHCDCTGAENSFGLNVGTYKFAMSYPITNNCVIAKCKINYEDIGRIVHNGEKVRCFKITVLE